MKTRDKLSHWAAAGMAPVVAQYIRVQRNRRIADAMPLEPAARGRLAPYFTAGDLDAVRLFVTHGNVVPEPPLAAVARGLGLQFPSMALVEGITLENLIALRPPLHDALLFHELVHVVQYRLLGLRRFCHRYTRGLLATGAYEEIPLERCAYELEARFLRSPSPFAVEDEVRAWCEADRF